MCIIPAGHRSIHASLHPGHALLHPGHAPHPRHASLHPSREPLRPGCILLYLHCASLHPGPGAPPLHGGSRQGTGAGSGRVTAPARCSRPKDVANAHIDVGNNTLLNTRLRYTCNPGYKRKAGTSSLIQCILREGSTEPNWTHTTLQCIRDPALPPQTPSPELPTVPHTEGTTQKGTTDASPTSNPSPAATSGMPGAAGRSPTPPATDGPSLEKSTLPEMPPRLQTSTPGEGMAPGSSLGTTPLPTAPMDHAAVSIQTLASSIGLPVLVVAGIVTCCCWRIKTRTGQSYMVPVTAIPMVAPAAENDEMMPPGVFPTG
ncbi:PREDICTED: interleukin-15 receptor subunit alpha-like isoform X2 [Haliaeetus leucocephalus]|uniref:interleukin-15 receptor subunit alpha-like isoform X2 n=1 Tax=Haliaeetus leucocephalus TaxID=52644 RepID=UPI00053CB841|nr:PREDICTED: interleukin-15 receptor subunit alpha-like isoform X2 [Haliaeetus leucocephalus]